MNKSLLTYDIYTDGSAKGNQYTHARGGWAYCILHDGNMIRHDSGFVADTTNQRMELQAVIEALKACEALWNPNYEYHLYSDSAYLINCYEQKWYENWEKNGWVTTARKPVSNSELWAEIIPYFRRKSFFFHKVKGHEDDYYNNYVDELAQKAADKR